MTSPQDPVTTLWAALRAEDDALAAAAQARAQQAQLLHELREGGLPTTHVAHRLATYWGTPLSIRDRLRLAERLRKRARRGTRRPALLPAPHGLPAEAPIRSAEGAITPADQENAMGKLLKRVTTEEWIATNAEEELDALDDDGTEEPEDEEESED